MVQLLVTSIELKELSKLLSCEPVRQGLYYHKSMPLEMFSLNELLVAVKNFTEADNKAVVLNYSFNMPAWRRSAPDVVKHIANTRRNPRDVSWLQD